VRDHTIVVASRIAGLFVHRIVQLVACEIMQLLVACLPIVHFSRPLYIFVFARRRF
jgi:hypothetical protein